MKLMRQRPARVSTGVVGLALAGLALTGCGPSLGIHPGSAVLVGDRSLSMSHIDSRSSLYCKAYVPIIQQQSQGGKVPMRFIRQFVAASLTERLIGEELADTYDVQPAKGYAQNQAQLQEQFASLPQDQLDAVLDVGGGDPYLQNVQVAVEDGQVKLARDQTSYPVSALAVSGAQSGSQPDASYTGSLTPSQLCG